MQIANFSRLFQSTVFPLRQHGADLNSVRLKRIRIRSDQRTAKLAERK